MDNDILRYIKDNPELVVRYMASKRFLNYARYINPKLEITDFHRTYYECLDLFAHKKIRRMIVSVPPQHGKLIADSEPVPTPGGFRRHGDLKAGDMVFGRDGKPVRVLNVFPKDYASVEVVLSDGSIHKCHPRHEWVVFDRGRERTVEADYLLHSTLHYGPEGKRGGRYRFKVDSPTFIDYPERDVAIDPYTLGAWLGDGKASEPLIYIGCDDTGIIERIPYGSHEQKGTTARVFYFPELRPLLKGLYNNKHIPEDYIFNSERVRRELIAGLIDTDGYVYRKNGRVTISNTNKDIIEGAALILRSLGENPVICDFPPSVSSSGIKGNRTVYQLCFNPSSYYPVQVPRKTIGRLVSPGKRAIVAVRESAPEQGNCIQVEGGIYLIGKTFVPTHNSEGSSRLLPSFMLGLDPDQKIVIGSYNADVAENFNRDVQRIIKGEQYRQTFPDSFVNDGRVRVDNVYRCNADTTEMVGRKGSLVAVGRNGSLTSRTVDVSILDDVYKDFQEANSPTVREIAWKWYTTVVRSRLHNNSQELIVFTRWHEDDLIGRLEKSGEKIIYVKSMKDILKAPKDAWILINFPAFKVSEPTELDPREEGQPLWPERHSAEELQRIRTLDPVNFECLYQGDPGNDEGKLYSPFKTYAEKSEYGVCIRKGCCVDVADTGTDNLCAIAYDVYMSPNKVMNEKTKKWEPILFALVTGIEFTPDGTEVTYITVPRLINENGTQKVFVESNAGGSQFGQNIQKKIRALVELNFRSANKESRILTNAPDVNRSIVFPVGWERRWPEFYKHITKFLRFFKGNSHDDGPDCLTYIYEKEIAPCNTKPYKHQHRGVKKRN